MSRIQSSPTFDRLLTWALLHQLSTPAGYTVTTLLLVGTALFRALLVTNLLPYLLFIPTVLLVALLMGRRTGLYAAVLSALLAGLTLIDRSNPMLLTGTQWIATILYGVVMISVTLVAAELRAAFQRSTRLTAELAEANASLATANSGLAEHERQLQLVNQELGHRLKNQLAIVQAIAGQTLRQSSDVTAAGEALGLRLAALARATDMLTATEWRSADLDMLARETLANHAGLADRVRIHGPKVSFNPQVALGLTLAFHELMTNATKYGALSNDSGFVDLNWSLEAGAVPGEQQFHLIWREVGGPPVAVPSRRGFGSVMIERSLRSYFRGETVISYAPDGVVFRIDAPFDATHTADE